MNLLNTHCVERTTGVAVGATKVNRILGYLNAFELRAPQRRYKLMP